MAGWEAALAARGLELRPSPSKGGTRGVFATRDFACGEIVLTSAPIATAVSPSDRLSRCGFCFAHFQRANDAKRCAGCKVAMYCSKECQTADWRVGGHRFICKDELLSSDTDSEMLFRSALVAMLPTDETTPALREAVSIFATLEDHFEQMPGNMQGEYLRMAEAVRERLIAAADKLKVPASRVPSTQALARDLARFGCNNFEVYDDELFTYGLGIFPAGALLNHECRPACVALYRLREHGMCEQEIRCTRDVPAGSELTVTYLDAIASDEARREITRSKYHFDCRCERCTGLTWMDAYLGAPLLKACDGHPNTRTVPPAMLWSALASHSKGDRLFLERLSPRSIADIVDERLCVSADAGRPDVALWSAEALCDTCRASLLDANSQYDDAFAVEDPAERAEKLRNVMRLQLATLHPLNRQHIAACNQSVDALLELAERDWRRAFYAAVHVAIIYAFSYQPRHPLLAVQLVNAGKLALYGGMLADAQRCLAEARSTLALLHPPKARCVTSIDELLSDIAQRKA